MWWLSGGKRGGYHNCSVLYCVLKLCTVISTLRWAVLTVLWIGFCHTGSTSLGVNSSVFICVYFVFFHTSYEMYFCNTVWWTWWNWRIIIRNLSSFSASTLLVWSFDLWEPVPGMTYNVFGRTLNLTQLQLNLKSSTVPECIYCATSTM